MCREEYIQKWYDYVQNTLNLEGITINDFLAYYKRIDRICNKPNITYNITKKYEDVIMGRKPKGIDRRNDRSRLCWFMNEVFNLVNNYQRDKKDVIKKYQQPHIPVRLKNNKQRVKPKSVWFDKLKGDNK